MHPSQYLTVTRYLREHYAFTLDQVMVVVTIFDQWDPMDSLGTLRLKDVAASSQLAKASFSKAIKLLCEKLGLAVLEYDFENQREKYLKLTPEGVAMMGELGRLFEDNAAIDDSYERAV